LGRKCSEKRIPDIIRKRQRKTKQPNSLKKVTSNIFVGGRIRLGTV
jgi:hypothetical protein